jgi:hypothetical protein
MRPSGVTKPAAGIALSTDLKFSAWILPAKVAAEREDKANRRKAVEREFFFMIALQIVLFKSHLFTKYQNQFSNYTRTYPPSPDRVVRCISATYH